MEQERYIFVETYGCQMNDSDSDKIVNLLSSHNYRPTRDINKADLVILNTCSIRHKAEQKVYSYLGTLREYKDRKPGMVIGVGGCVAQQNGEKLLKRVPHLDIVFGTHNIHKLPELISRAREGSVRAAETAFFDDPAVFIRPQTGDRATGTEEARVSGLVTVMLGCDNFCSYCIVPFVRGREISRPSTEIINEIEGVVSGGVREVNLIGQNVNSYGHGALDGINFPALLGMVNGVKGLTRVRFTTSHPKDISSSLIESFGSLDKLCEHIHLPVQSGSDTVLGRMNRGYGREEYLGRVNSLRKRIPGMAISSDIIVGFPGEMGSDFDATMDLINEVRFDSLFSFKYSPRPETKAAKMQDQVDEDIKAKRLEVLQEKQRKISHEKNAEYEGRVVEILVEGRSETNPGRFSGRTRTNKTVNFEGSDDLKGRLVHVKIVRGSVNSLAGELV